MSILAELLTWEHILVVWGLIAPGIAWAATRGWDRKNQLALWNHEADLRREAAEAEEKRIAEARERHEEEQLRDRMRDTYTRYLSNASDLALAAELPYADQRRVAIERALPEAILSYQQLLMIASEETAAPAVKLWTVVRALTSLDYTIEQLPQLREETRSARASFVREARSDISNPVERHSNPPIRVTPALSAGGFNLQDVG